MANEDYKALYEYASNVIDTQHTTLVEYEKLCKDLLASVQKQNALNKLLSAYLSSEDIDEILEITSMEKLGYTEED